MGEGKPLELEELEKRPLLSDRLVQAPFPQVLFALGTGAVKVLRVYGPFVKCLHPSLLHQARPMS